MHSRSGRTRDGHTVKAVQLYRIEHGSDFAASHDGAERSGALDAAESYSTTFKFDASGCKPVSARLNKSSWASGQHGLASWRAYDDAWSTLGEDSDFAKLGGDIFKYGCPTSIQALTTATDPIAPQNAIFFSHEHLNRDAAMGYLYTAFCLDRSTDLGHEDDGSSRNRTSTEGVFCAAIALAQTSIDVRADPSGEHDDHMGGYMAGLGGDCEDMAAYGAAVFYGLRAALSTAPRGRVPHKGPDKRATSAAREWLIKILHLESKAAEMHPFYHWVSAREHLLQAMVRDYEPAVAIVMCRLSYCTEFQHAVLTLLPTRLSGEGPMAPGRAHPLVVDAMAGTPFSAHDNAVLGHEGYKPTYWPYLLHNAPLSLWGHGCGAFQDAYGANADIRCVFHPDGNTSFVGIARKQRRAPAMAFFESEMAYRDGELITSAGSLVTATASLADLGVSARQYEAARTVCHRPQLSPSSMCAYVKAVCSAHAPVCETLATLKLEWATPSLRGRVTGVLPPLTHSTCDAPTPILLPNGLPLYISTSKAMPHHGPVGGHGARRGMQCTATGGLAADLEADARKAGRAIKRGARGAEKMIAATVHKAGEDTMRIGEFALAKLKREAPVVIHDASQEAKKVASVAATVIHHGAEEVGKEVERGAEKAERFLKKETREFRRNVGEQRSYERSAADVEDEL